MVHFVLISLESVSPHVKTGTYVHGLPCICDSDWHITGTQKYVLSK